MSKNAFLNGDLQEEVYMAPPPSVHMNLGMFGLKQALRA